MFWLAGIHTKDFSFIMTININIGFLNALIPKHSVWERERHAATENYEGIPMFVSGDGVDGTVTVSVSGQFQAVVGTIRIALEGNL